MEREEGRRAEALDRYWDAVLEGNPPTRRDDIDDVMAAVVAHLATSRDAPADEAARERTRRRILARTQTMEASMILQHHVHPAVLPVDLGTLPQPSRNRTRWAATQLATVALLLLTIVMGLVTFGGWQSGGPESPLLQLSAPSTQVPAASTPEASPQASTALAEFVAEIPLDAGPMSAPEAVAVGPDGTIYVLDSFQDEIRLFDRDGQPGETWGETGEGPGQFRFHDGGAGFGDLAVGPDGNLYIADPFNHRIQVLSPDGEFVREWGELGAAEGQFAEPGGLGIDSSGRVYVADTDNGRVQIFDPEGQFLAAWTASAGEGGSRPSPNDVTIDAADIVSVADATTKQVIQFEADGTVVGAIGGVGSGSDLGGLAIDAQGSLFVTDYVGNQIHVFNPDGSLRGAIGSVGAQPGQFISPSNVALGPDGLLYVADEGNRRIQIFRLLLPAVTELEIVTETLIDVTNIALPPSHAQVYTTITELQPGASVAIDGLAGTMALLIEQGSVRIAYEGEERAFQAGELWNASVNDEIRYENVGDELVRIIEAGAMDATVSTTAKPEGAFSDPMGGVENYVITDATTFAGGTARLVLERLTFPPGAVLAPYSQPEFRWVGLVTGRLGVTLEGEPLPFRWDSGEERTYGVSQSLPVIAPGTEVTMRNAEDRPMVLYRLTIEPDESGGAPIATPAP